MPKTIEITDIRDRDRKRHGEFVTGAVEKGSNATIVVGKSIRLHGARWAGQECERKHDITFNVGDQAVYDSYNLTYVGEIVAIGPKTVTIVNQFGEKKRLSIYEFNWRNRHFDLEKIARDNHATSMCI